MSMGGANLPLSPGMRTARGYLGWFLLLATLLLLVPHMTKVLVWANKEGKFPIKPRDYNIAAASIVLLLVLLRRPAFCLPALALLTVPVLRILDAALLKRYQVIGVIDDHDLFVLNISSSLLISVCAVLCLTAANGMKIVQWVAVATILVVAGSIYYEALGLEKFTTIPGRMAGFLDDPNAGPIHICLMLGILFTLQTRFWWNVALIGFSTPAVALTFSRSGMSVFAFMVAVYLLVHFRRNFVTILLLGLIAIPVLIGGVATLQAVSRQGIVKDTNTESRFQAIYELDFDRLGSQERAKDLLDGWEAVCQRPIVGYGTGSGSSEWQPHNQVVSVWLDLGLSGVVLYLASLLLVSLQSLRRGLRGFFCMMPVWLFIPCSQTLLDTPAYWLSAAVACHVAFSGRFQLLLSSAKAAQANGPRPATAS